VEILAKISVLDLGVPTRQQKPIQKK